MKSQRGNLRTSRKADPVKTAVAVKSEGSNQKRSTRSSIRLVSKLKPKTKAGKSAGPLVPDRRLRVVDKSKKPKEENLAVERKSSPDTASVSCDVNSNGVTVDSRRRRTDSAEYIKRRFLYDSSEPSRRDKSKVHNSRSTVALMAVSTANLLTRKARSSQRVKSETGTLSRQKSRRGRRLKPKLDYSPSYSQDIESLPSPQSHLDKSTKGSQKGKARQIVKRSSTDRRSSWELPDVFEAEVSSSGETDRVLSSRNLDIVHFHNNKYMRAERYSDVLLDDLPTYRNEELRSYRFQRTVSHRSATQKRQGGSSQFQNSNLHKGTDAFDSHSLLSGRLSPVDAHSEDMIEYPTDLNTGRFDRSRTLEDLDAEVNYLHSPESHDMSEPSQAPNEDLEEEDLLAPELSILSGPATVSSPDGVLLSSIPDTSSIFTGTLLTPSSSRRKSPVRPMQVIRTKSSTHTTVATPSCTQMSMLGGVSDNGPFVYTQSVGYVRRLSNNDTKPDDDCLPTVYQQSATEHSHAVSDALLCNAPAGLKPPSIVRLASMNTSGATSIAIRPLQDRARVPDEAVTAIRSDTPNAAMSPPLLPPILNPSPSNLYCRAYLWALRVPAHIKHTLTTLIRHSSATNRRRPTILKRSAVPVAANTSPTAFVAQPGPVSHYQASDLNGEAPLVPVSRTIGAFTPSAAHLHKSSLDVTDLNPTASCLTTGPTKLHQLMTAPQISPSLTASDRLFGRRTGAYSKSSLLSAVAMPTVPSQSSGVVEPLVATGAPPNTNPSYRYAILRGSADGKRYLVLGSQGIFDRSSCDMGITPGVLSKLASDNHRHHHASKPTFTTRRPLCIFKPSLFQDEAAHGTAADTRCPHQAIHPAAVHFNFNDPPSWVSRWPLGIKLDNPSSRQTPAVSLNGADKLMIICVLLLSDSYRYAVTERD
ncbi:hypothetical protein AHF37_00768 [Paragonimus kellicotti]|nr:hypothetical protein AHF37_00768 [Paragonimus kellicotti]